MKNEVNKIKNIIVAHPAQQHSYRTVTAIKNNNRLFRYITTVYNKEKSIKMSFIKLFLGQDNLKRANRRNCEKLNDYEVIQFCENRGIVELLLIRINKNLYNWWSIKTTNKFGKRVANYAIKNNVDAVIMYDTKANRCFEILKKKAPNIKRILDMSAPSLAYMDKIFKEDMIKFPIYCENIKYDMDTAYYNNEIENSINEIKNANYFLVASEFAKKSLNHNNISSKNIFKCPYGIDNEYFNPDFTKKYKDDKLHCIFIGRVTSQKGAFHLLNTLKKINSELIDIVFLGAYDSKSKYYQEFNSKCSFLGHVSKECVREQCQKADLLIFPSMADGYGLSVLEAMACGLPVICSSNAGVSDIIIDNYNGFKIEAGNDDKLKEKIEWCINNKDELKKMGINAIRTANDNSWEKYYEKIELSIKQIEQNNK